MSNSGYNQTKGFTIIELVMVMVIVGILAVPGAYLLMHFVQNSIFVPNQLNADYVLNDLLNIVVEGDTTAGGMRFGREMTSISGNDITFVDQNGQSVRYRLDTSDNKMYRSINAGAEAVVPYYVPTNIVISGINSAVFVFYDASEATTAVGADVRWVKIQLNVDTGSHGGDGWEGTAEGQTSVAVHKYQ